MQNPNWSEASLMSYHDKLSNVYDHLCNAAGDVSDMKMGRILIEISHAWFVEHGLTPTGEQAIRRDVYLLTQEEIWELWRTSNPTVRWKETN